MSWKAGKAQLIADDRMDEYKAAALEAEDKYGELTDGALWELLAPKFQPLSRDEKDSRALEKAGHSVVTGRPQHAPAPRAAPTPPPKRQSYDIEEVTREKKIGLVSGGVWDENYPERDAIKWVLDHLNIKEMMPEDAPCAFAWTQYAHFSVTTALRGKYLTDFGSKFVPTRSQLEGETKYKDDGRDVDGLIDELLHILEPEEEREMEKWGDRVDDELNKLERTE